MGKWDDWAPADEQNHRMGPAVFGKFDLGTKQAIKYDAALLFGSSEAAANKTFRMQMEYELLAHRHADRCGTLSTSSPGQG